MNVQLLSAQFTVKDLNKEDASVVYDLCKGNTIFYKYHPPFVTVESIIRDMDALPPNKEYKDKHYIGFLEGNKLIAVMDLIENYPNARTALIGFFAVNPQHQTKGVGTAIISDCLSYLSQIGFKKVRLGIDQDNPQSKAFWIKNGFTLTQEEYPNDFSSVFIMEKLIKN